MSSTSLVAPARIETNRLDGVQAEVEAGLVFAAAAIEYQTTHPARAETCRAEAEDCKATALDLIREAGFTQDELYELNPILNQLQERLSRLRLMKAPSSAAAA